MKISKNILFGFYLLVLVGIAGGYLISKQSKEARRNSVASLGVGSNGTDKIVYETEQRLKNDPDSVELKLMLSNAYLQKVRESADVGYYSKIDRLMESAEKSDPNNPDIFSLRANVALGRHQFRDALSLANKTIQINPDRAIYYGILADAQTELGMDSEAIESLQKMVDLRPDYSSFSRVAYARELRGDIPGAKQAILSAINAGSSFPENIAWGHVELGKLAARNDLDQAKKSFEFALTVVSDYPPALEGLGKVSFAKGDLDAAAGYFNKAFDKLPIAQYATNIADVYAEKGDLKKAEQYYALAKVAFDKSGSSGVNVDMEKALFLADHDLDLNLAEDLARRANQDRPSIYAADTLAWVLYKNGKSGEATQFVQNALRLGQSDPLIVFHAGMIEEKNGNMIKAQEYFSKVKTLNPNFSMAYAKILNEKIK